MTNTESKHSPEPWLRTNAGAVDKNNVPVSIINDANAERIIACVNACTGIEEPEKSVPSIAKKLVDIADAVLKSFGGTFAGDELAVRLIKLRRTIKDIITQEETE